MAKVFGKEQTKAELLKKVGNLEQIAYVRSAEYVEGKAAGLRTFEVSNGEIEFTVLKDRCLDIGTLKYKGVPLNFLAKPGVTNPLWSQEGDFTLRSIIGGMLFTCGLRNVGPANELFGEKHVMHGRLRNTPAHHICGDARWIGDDYVIRMSGQTREAVLFGENLVLSRCIETKLGSNTITITDEIENEGFEEQPFMLLYHFNVGYPLLDDGAELLLPPHETIPRDDYAIEVEKAQCVQHPEDGFHERVYYHRLKAADGRATVALINEARGIGLAIEYDAEALPHFVQWKSMASGDYVMGLEPSNCHVGGAAKEQEAGMLRTLKPQEKQTIRIELRVLEGEELFALIKAMRN